MRIFCTVKPFIFYLFGKDKVYAAHLYFDSDDKYEYDQIIFYTDRSFRVAKPGMTPRKNETVVTGASVLTCRCGYCNHKEQMWMRDNKTLDDVPLMAIGTNKQ